jgi:nitrite reductase/ring-hydroxylating ferredoxin subunit
MTRRLAIPAAKLPSLGARTQLSVEGNSIIVFNVQGSLYAIDATCPHAGASLANGKLDGRIVQCRAHGLRFDLLTGCMAGLTGGHGLSVKTYVIEVDDGQAYLTLPEIDAASQ